MIVGIPREIKESESRVAMTPEGVKSFSRKGHSVLVEIGAGIDSGISDDDYEKAGAEIVSTREVFSRSEMIVKVKEPLPQEYGLIRPDQIVFSYFHFASSQELTRAMIESRAVCVAYETVTVDGRLPLLAPMSEIAGKMAVQIAAHYLCKPCGGSGILMSGIFGVDPARVLVIGGGTVGRNAARLAKNMDADVTIIQLKGRSFEFLKKNYPDIRLVESNPLNILMELKEADVVIGAAYIKGAKTPRLITRKMVREMQPGSVIVDVSIDQGGIAETSRPTTHNNPIFFEEGVLHYCVANMPGAYPRTSTYALTNATLPFVLELAEKGLGTFRENPALLSGLNIFNGKVTNKAVAEAFNLNYSDPLKIVE
jgi:alanine dehydrogenase